MTGKTRLEQDGLYVSSPEHWETWETKMRIYKSVGQSKYKTAIGEIRSCLVRQKNARIIVPMDLVRHLKLEHGDKIQVAIRKVIKQ